jgi:nucleoside-diphosphate-sugar epimerase
MPRRQLNHICAHLAAGSPPPVPVAMAMDGSSAPITVVVLGGTGHVGSYLCPRLAAGPRYEVVCVSWGTREPYAAAGGSWDGVERLAMARPEDEAEQEFVDKVAALQADVVIDMICFTAASCRRLVEGLAGTGCTHFLHTGTIWVHGHSLAVPTLEGIPSEREPLEEYGRTKNEIEQYLLHDGAKDFPCTILHAGHIVGRRCE